MKAPARREQRANPCESARNRETPEACAARVPCKLLRCEVRERLNLAPQGELEREHAGAHRRDAQPLATTGLFSRRRRRAECSSVYMEVPVGTCWRPGAGATATVGRSAKGATRAWGVGGRITMFRWRALVNDTYRSLEFVGNGSCSRPNQSASR